MCAPLLLALVSLTALADDYPGRFHRFCDRTAQGRTNRGLLCDGLAFFEFAPTSGAGMPAACSTTAPTGAKGETLTFARASVATCTPTATGGLTTTGISTQSLVEVTNNVARVEYDANGVLGLLVESLRAQVLFRFIDYANALWSDIGTPTLTGSQTSPFAGTYATSAVQFDDNDGAAYEGRQQTVTVSAGVAHTMHCYVRAGTATAARITLDGTAATITGLSSSTWSIVEVTDASSSGVAIVAQVMNGDAPGDTGTVTWGGCQVEAGSYRTSIMPSVAAGVTRSAETADFAGLMASNQTRSLAFTASPLPGISWAASGYTVQFSGGATSGALTDPYFWPYSNGGSINVESRTTGTPSPQAAGPVGGALPTTAGSSARMSVFMSSTQLGVCRDTTCVSNAFTPGVFTFTRLMIGYGGAGRNDAIWSRICADPDPNRCR